ncbi:flagellar basal-body MS-ring/collar protein FliF [Pantoea sp. MBD-2R]|uniref:flagellar basal-body MS-ring/collar protein FliF n=1 Tax=Pantoea sp. MBD-2R TaxID=3141540 RepID=UPI003182C336
MNEKIRACRAFLTDERLKKWLLPGVVAIAATAIVVAMLWQNDNHYILLYGSQENIPVAQVVEVLSGEQISYRVEPNSGNLLVRETDLPKARMALASKGVAAHSPAGYELMDKESVLGSSQFIQNVRFRRSLEGELAQSIMALDAVEFARVHLGLSETSSFVLSNKPDSTASVMLRVHVGRQLSDEQVTAIVNLVAGSVPGMKLSEVRVVDQHGSLLSASTGTKRHFAAGSKTHGDLLQQMRQETERSLANLLAPVVGADNFRISVVPRVNFNEIEETRERFLKPQRQSSYDRDVRHIRHPGYQLEKLSVSVVINRAAPAVAAWTPENQAQVQQMLNQAAGIETSRGDVLTLSLLSFPEIKPDSEPPLPWWEKPDLINWGQRGGLALLILSALVLLLKRIRRRPDRT